MLDNQDFGEYKDSSNTQSASVQVLSLPKRSTTYEGKGHPDPLSEVALHTTEDEFPKYQLPLSNPASCAYS